MTQPRPEVPLFGGVPELSDDAARRLYLLAGRDLSAAVFEANEEALSLAEGSRTCSMRLVHNFSTGPGTGFNSIFRDQVPTASIHYVPCKPQ